MTLPKIAVLAGDPSKEKFWTDELKRALQGFGEVIFEKTGEIVFIDAEWAGAPGALNGLEKKGRAVFLMVREGSPAGGLLGSGKVDDVLVHPFRPLEAWSKLKQFQQLMMWDEVSRMNTSLTELVERFKNDLQLAERLQKSRLPIRFPEIKDMKVASRYLAGMRSGGDHFDLAESKNGQQLSIVLSDASSYGLSGAMLSVLMSVAVKLSAEEVRSSSETVKRIHQELTTTLNDKDKLSLFYGVLSRKDLKLRFLNLGTSCAFVAPQNGEFKRLPSQGGPITRAGGFSAGEEGEIGLNPSDRFALISDGYIDVLGGPDKTCDLLNRFREKELNDTLNELVFAVKSRFAEPDDMPEQDCTAVIFDVDPKVLRLA